MTEEQLKAFLDIIKADRSLADKLNAARDAEAYVAVAAEAGFAFSAEEIELERSQVSEVELEGSAKRLTTTYISQSCRKTCGDNWGNC